MIVETLLHDRNYDWIDVSRPETKDVERLTSEFGLSHLFVQDCLRPEHLPKYESTDEDTHFLMLRSFDENSGQADTTVQELTRKIAIFIKNNRVVSIHRVELDFLDTLHARCEAPGNAPKTIQGLVHQMILAVIKSYDRPVDQLQDTYEFFESEILAKRAEHLSMKKIYQFRRQVFVIKRILRQSNDALSRFRDFWNDQPSMLQDLKENIDQLYFMLDEISDNFDHLFQLHISLNDQRANQVMKVLTVFSTILLPLNFIASFFGMNFTLLPGLETKEGLYLVVGWMLLTAFVTMMYFRLKGWFSRPKE